MPTETRGILDDLEAGRKLCPEDDPVGEMMRLAIYEIVGLRALLKAKDELIAAHERLILALRDQVDNFEVEIDSLEEEINDLDRD